MGLNEIVLGASAEFFDNLWHDGQGGMCWKALHWSVGRSMIIFA